MNSMPRSANAASSASEVSGDGGTGRPERDHEEISQSLAHAARREIVVQQQRRLARRRRALEGRAADADRRARPARERGQDLGEPFGAGDRVELVAGLGEPGRRGDVVVGAERDHEHVGLVAARVGRHPPRLGIDRGDRLLQEPHAGLDEVAVRRGAPRRASCDRTSRRASSSRTRTRRSCRSASPRRSSPSASESSVAELETAEARPQDHHSFSGHPPPILAARGDDPAVVAVGGEARQRGARPSASDRLRVGRTASGVAVRAARAARSPRGHARPACASAIPAAGGGWRWRRGRSARSPWRCPRWPTGSRPGRRHRVRAGLLERREQPLGRRQRRDRYCSPGLLS